MFPFHLFRYRDWLVCSLVCTLVLGIPIISYMEEAEQYKVVMVPCTIDWKKPPEQRFDNCIEVAHIKYDVRAEVLKARMVESRFDHKAKKGEYGEGLMLISDESALRCQIEPRMPDQNIFCFAKELRRLLDKYNNDYQAALAHYHDGSEAGQSLHEYPNCPGATNCYARKTMAYASCLKDYPDKKLLEIEACAEVRSSVGSGTLWFGH